MEQQKYIISIDLGDGETSVAYALTNGKEEPKIAELEEGEKSMITAIATKKGTGEPLIGDNALLAEGTFENSLNIKVAPTSVPATVWRNSKSRLKNFIETLCEEYLKLSYPEIYSNANVYIGHPSGWSAEDVEQYKEIFEGTKIPGVTIRSESRAAFIQVRDYRGLSIDELKSVLVIDIGSSTTDLTFVKDLEPVELPVGSQFGARLIDCLIYNYVKEHCSEREKLIEWLQTKARNKAFLLYLCRKAKEYYFSTKQLCKPERPAHDGDLAWIFDTCWPLLEELDMNKMETLLKQPVVGSEIEEVLERRSKESIDFPKGWKESFKNLLHQAKREYRYNKLELLEPKVVLLTGGGSRMKFTEEICREVFCSALVNPDKDPFFSVAKGLAGFGRWEYRVDQFHKEINKFCDTEDLMGEIQKNITSFANAVKKLLYQKLNNVVWRSIALEMRNGTLTADEIGDPLKYSLRKLDEYYQTCEGQKCQETVIKKYLGHIEPYINSETDGICERFFIGKQNINIKFGLKSEEFFMEQNIIEGFLYKINGISGKYSIKAVDKFISVKVRQWVPEAAVNLCSGVNGLYISGVDVHINRFAFPISQETKEKFAINIREQIREQLLKRAEEVEKYVR